MIDRELMLPPPPMPSVESDWALFLDVDGTLLDFAPTPTPISLVDFRAPDFGRFPRFREAMQRAIVVELEPGDALYLPSFWWHHVESSGVLNVMVNYWWSAPAARGLDKAAVLALATLGREK